MGTQAHILVSDDEAPIRDLLAGYFSKHGYRVTTVATAEETFRAVDETPFQLVVLDIALGDADGLEVLAQLKAVHPRLPVLLLTGMGFDEDLLQEARQKGADGYISKTLPLDQLLMEAVRALKYRRNAV